jgi:hypothetical protein
VAQSKFMAKWNCCACWNQFFDRALCFATEGYEPYLQLQEMMAQLCPSDKNKSQKLCLFSTDP